MRLGEIASALDIVFEGDEREIEGLATLENAKPSELAYCDHAKFIPMLEKTKAGAVLVSAALLPHVPAQTQALITPRPHLCMAKISALFTCKPFDMTKPPCIAQSASVDPRAVVGSESSIGEGSYIMPHVSVGAHVSIGKGVMIYPNVVIYDHSIIGDGCILHAGCVIGSDGFGYAHTAQGEHIKMYHSGNVVLEEGVEVGANSTIDRAVFGSTVIKKGTKIDNLVQIAHNCEIGEHSIIVSQTGISGSTKLGRNVIMGGQSATSGHLRIGDFATIAGRGAVTKSIEGGKTYGGFPLMLQSEWLKTQAKIARFFKKQSTH